jgi:hypothetical protein
MALGKKQIAVGKKQTAVSKKQTAVGKNQTTLVLYLAILTAAENFKNKKQS